MSDLKVGIIGAGNIAAEHLKVLRDITDLEVVGITSRTRTKAEKFANEFGIFSIHDTIGHLVDNCSPDALLILVSADQIFSVAQKTIPFKIPVFIEKPPGINPSQTAILSELAEKYNVRNMVGYNRRYYSIFQKGIEVIKKHGKLLGVAVEGHERFWNVSERVNEIIRSNWIYANSTHTIDLLRFFGGNIKNISTAQNSFMERNGDQFAAVIEFENDALGHYMAHWYSPGGWSVRLFGEGVTVNFTPLEKGVWMKNDFKINEITPEEVDLKYKPGFYRQMEAFVKMVKTGKLDWPGQELLNAYDTMLLAQNIRQGVNGKR